MRYKAVILLGSNKLTNMFNTVGSAEQWIDSNNNNHDYTSYIQEIDNLGNVVDWFYYTEVRR